MLAADKLQLQSALKQQATALKEKEFNLHHSNLMTVGTQAAVLAGLDITMFIEFQPVPTSDWPADFRLMARILKFCYYMMIVAAFCSNITVVSQTTALSVFGAGLALRGPDGSMMTATDGLYEERRSVFLVFGIGLACTVLSVVLCVWLILSWEAALVCMCVTIYTCHKIYDNYCRVVQRFSFDESETVDFTDIFEGPAAIRAVPSNVRRFFTTTGGNNSNKDGSSASFMTSRTNSTSSNIKEKGSHDEGDNRRNNDTYVENYGKTIELSDNSSNNNLQRRPTSPTSPSLLTV